ncbi:MAG: ATP-binding cassette, subfamily bacterial [Blastocatellia bacterium]|jgi:ABC-type multidrug transport system fused ATPase/permease subunit|nr:ATP-binding cassette, subfamily bacterial [Blastocatellia bacterium]
MSSSETPPTNAPGVTPAKTRSGQPIGGLPPEGLPPGALPDLPAGEPPMPGPGDGKIRMKTMPKMNAGPYLGRAFKLLGGHKAMVALSLFLSLVMFLLPFVAAAAFGPLIKLFGDVAKTGNWNNVWTVTGSFYDKTAQTGGSSFPWITDWLGTPLTFTTIFIIWTCAIVLRNVLDIFRAWVDANLEQRLLTGLRQKLYEHIQSLSLDFFMGGQTGALMQRVLSETTAVQRLLTQVLLTPVVDSIVLIIVIGYLLALSWQMTVVLFVLAPLTVLMFRFTSGKLQQGAMGINLSSRDLGSELEETINGISDIQVFNAQPKRNERFREASRIAAKNTASTTAWMSLSNSGAQVLISLTTALILLSAIMFGQKWGLTFASALVFMQMAPNLFTPVQRLISSYTMYQSLVPGIVSTYELFDTKPTVVEKPGAVALGEVHGDITFENIVFGYSPTQKVLNGVSFELKEGETIAFVGPIGCGKSTIMNLILRFLDPEQGRILLEGKDIADVTLTSLREQVSKLAQFPFFLKDTIRENVRLGRAGATDAEIEEACKLAHIHDVIVDPQRMPKGYDTIVGVQVPSGGQKRLIALARCLLRKPEVLLLDEPTENLDAAERNRLTQVIREYANERTCLVISHDLNFVADVADRILVIDKGRIVDQGTHDELVSREGLYKTLYGLKNVDPSLLRARDGGGAAQPAPGTPIGGMDMPGGGMPPGMSMPM